MTIDPFVFALLLLCASCLGALTLEFALLYLIKRSQRTAEAEIAHAWMRHLGYTDAQIHYVETQPVEGDPITRDWNTACHIAEIAHKALRNQHPTTRPMTL